MYMKALAAANIHTAGVLSTCFWISFTDLSAWDRDFSCARVSTGGNPLDSGVSWSQQRMTITPMAPAAADPKKPACHPAKVTIDPTKRNEKNSPRLWLAEKNP